MVGSAMVERAQAADRIFGIAPLCDMAEAPAVSALSITVGGVGPLNCVGPGEKSD